MTIIRKPIEAFYKIEENGCWTWTGHITKKGYGLYRLPGTIKTQMSHRVVYERYYGKIPLGMQLDHLCRNRACVNPKHMEVVSGTENHRRGLGVKISKEIADKIKQEYKEGKLLQKEIGAKYGVTNHCVSKIVRNKTWQ